MKCAHCGQENPAGFQFCDHCGEPLPTVGLEAACPACSHLNPVDMKFCEQCGVRLDVRVCPACSHENPLEFKYCEECGLPAGSDPQTVSKAGRELGAHSTIATSFDSAGAVKTHQVEIQETRHPRTADRQKGRINGMKLLSSLAMRFVFGSIVGFGVERAFNWLANTLLVP